MVPRRPTMDRPRAPSSRPQPSFPTSESWVSGSTTQTRNQRAKVLPVLLDPLRVWGQKDRNGCEFEGNFNLGEGKTRNTSCKNPLPVPRLPFGHCMQTILTPDPGLCG